MAKRLSFKNKGGYDVVATNGNKMNSKQFSN